MPRSDATKTRTQSIPVYRAADFKATAGANEGDPISFADDLVLDDIYELRSDAQTCRLAMHRTQDGGQRIADNTDIGSAEATLHLDCAVTFMANGASVTEALVLVEVDSKGNASDVFLLPLAPIQAKTDYQLVGMSTKDVAQKFAQVASVSFTRGTHITLGSGRQRRIEDLSPGDPVLTRDDGVQCIKWIAHHTQRAVGAFAPIRIAAGTLNNEHDLLVSPNHRLFIYQRTDRLGAGRSELLVQAKHLVNGETVTVQNGGFVDYFQLLFEQHQIIYAEGIAAESMLVDDRTASLLPETLSKSALQALLKQETYPLSGLDVQENLLDRPDAADLLRRASIR